MKYLPFFNYGWLAVLVICAARPISAAAPAPALEVMVESKDLFWNGVAVDGDRIFLSGPRALQPSGSTAPALAVTQAHGQLQPYPDKAWNSWKEGADNSRTFVNVNAIHRDDRGGLWAIDSGTPMFGGNTLPGAPKAVRIDLAANRVDRVYLFDPSVATPTSYVNDIRFHGDIAYLTDAGNAGIIVLDLKSGKARRTLEAHPSVKAQRPIVVDGVTLCGPDDKPLMVNSDPLEISPDGKWLYFGPAGGPWSAIETKWLEDAQLDPAVVASHVVPWADIPPTGGSAMDAKGNLYFSDLNHLALKRRAPKGRVSTVVQDPRLHWIDAPAIDEKGYIWLPVPQVDRAAAFNHGVSKATLPVQLFRLKIAE